MQLELKHTTLRPTTADAFSNSLQHLLSLPSTSSNPVPLRAPPSAATLRLERRARGVIRETKAQHLSRGHVRDVIGGWAARPPLPFSQWESKSARDFEKARRGGSLEEGETGAEREKRLRKLAQRGVVRLFNAIGAAQGVTGKDKEIEEQEARKKAAVKLNAGEIESGGTVNRRPNVLGGRGKGEARKSLLYLLRVCFTSTQERTLTFAFATQSRIFRKLLSSTSFELERRLVLLLQRSSSRPHLCIAITLSFTQLLAAQSLLRYDNRPLQALSRSRSSTPHLRVRIRLIGSSRRVGAPFLDDWLGSAQLRKFPSGNFNVLVVRLIDSSPFDFD